MVPSTGTLVSLQIRLTSALFIICFSAEERNQFRTHTVVNVLYCSGDIFIGDVTRDYNDSQGQPVVQAGFANAKVSEPPMFVGLGFLLIVIVLMV
jgi:hypothetical protein